MRFEEALARYFDDATTSLRITIASADVQLERRRDGAIEGLGRLTGSQKTSFVESLSQGVDCRRSHGVFSTPDREGAAYQFMWLPVDGEQILVIKRVWDGVIRPLAEMGIDAADAERIRRVLRPMEGVVVVSCPWCGSLPREVASVLREGWAGTGETGAHIADFIHWHVPGLVEIRVDSSDRPGLSRVVNTVRNMELLPVVIALCDEEVAVQEAFRLAQMDYLVYVVCDSRSVIETVTWLRQRVDHWVLSEYLTGVIGLRPVTGLCPHCARPDLSPDGEMLRKVGLDDLGEARLMTAGGCSACEGSGMAAPLLAWEMLSLWDNEGIASMMKGDTPESELMEAIGRTRGPSIQERARALLLSGRASLRHVEHDVFRPRFKT